MSNTSRSSPPTENLPTLHQHDSPDMRAQGSVVGRVSEGEWKYFPRDTDIHHCEEDHPDRAESATHIHRVIDSDNLHQELSYAPLLTRLSRPSPSSPHDPPTTSRGEADKDLSKPIRSICVLPGYIDEISGHVSSQDEQFLWRKGALTLPDDHLRNAFVECFVEYVHPTMPVVDLKEFLGALKDFNDSSKPRISCLLFQAVMFSAVSYVDLHILLNAGFASRREARKLFHERAKVRVSWSFPTTTTAEMCANIVALRPRRRTTSFGPSPGSCSFDSLHKTSRSNQGGMALAGHSNISSLFPRPAPNSSWQP
jgi:hypothetical protein